MATTVTKAATAMAPARWSVASIGPLWVAATWMASVRSSMVLTRHLLAMARDSAPSPFFDARVYLVACHSQGLSSVVYCW